MKEGSRIGFLLGLLRVALILPVLSMAWNVDPAEWPNHLILRPMLGSWKEPMAAQTGYIMAVYLAFSAALSVLFQATWRNVVLLVLDFCMATVLFLAYPVPVWAILFALPVLEAFQLNLYVGWAVALAAVMMFSVEASLGAPRDWLSQHLPFSISATLLAAILGMAIQSQRRSAHQKQALIKVIEASQELGSSATIEKVMQIVCEMVTALFRADSVAIFLIDEENPDEPMMRAKGVESPTPGAFPDFNPDVTPSVLHHVTKARQGQFFADFNQDDANERILAKDKDFRSVMIAPLMFEGKALGTMFCSYKVANRYTEETFHLYSLLSNQVALAVRNVQLQQGMAALAITDSLSGLYTHGYFQDHLGKEVTKSKYANQPLALMIMDMDFFKKVNDNYGHPQGDALLRQLGGVIKSVVRPNDTVCRYGGDEFTITMPETNRIQAVVVAERIRQAVEEYEFVLGSHIVHITVSGGVAAFPEEASTKKELVEKADQAMYEAKHKGRNKVCFAA